MRNGFFDGSTAAELDGDLVKAVDVYDREVDIAAARTRAALSFGMPQLNHKPEIYKRRAFKATSVPFLKTNQISDYWAICVTRTSIRQNGRCA